MTYTEAIDYLTHFPGFDPKEIINGKKSMNLDTVRVLLDKVGHPENRLQCIHIAGTNGKGSTAAFIHRILMQAQIRTGLFTSPFLVDWQEQIRVDDHCIDQTSLARLTSLVKKQVDTMEHRPSAFEITVVIAFMYFVQSQCQLVVLEVGLGGLHDATNAIPACVLAIITKIGLDHTEILGHTKEQIAYQKAGIIKKHCDVLVYPQQKSVCDTIQKVCKIKKATYHRGALPYNMQRNDTQTFYWNRICFEIKELGTYQVYNAALALDAIALLQKKGYTITMDAIKKGLLNTFWPARFEHIQKDPPIIIAGSHNTDGVQALIRSLKTYYPDKKITFVAGMLADKNYQDMVDLILPYANRVYTITPNNPRALHAAKLAAYIKKKGVDSTSFENLFDCLDTVLKKNEPVCIFGSLYYVGTARTYILSKKNNNE